MPKKIEETRRRYIEAVTQAIKATKPLRELYKDIYGVDPSRAELQQFANRFNPARSNPGTDILGLCVEHLPSLQTMTLAEFFGIEAQR